MYYLDQYTKDCIALANSLVVKVSDVAVAINKGLIDKYGSNYKIPTDKRQWKYYLNLAGIRHEDNTDVLVNVLEQGTKLPLSRELLSNSVYTKNELLKCGDTYNNLVNDYPTEVLFIHGCLYPVDIDTAINAKDGTILAYNSSYIEAAEYNLIRELEEYTKGYLARWHIREYTIIDELYLPAMLAGMYSNLPLKIANIRLEKVNTNEVHSFHLEHFFRSTLEIWDDLSVLSNSTKYWLYKNLTWIVNNIGRQEAFLTVIKKILTENSVGIGNYVLRKPNVSKNTEEGRLQPSYIQTDLMQNISNLNQYFISNSQTGNTIEALVNKELNLNKAELTDNEKERNENVLTEVKNALKYNIKDNQKTKLVEISSYQVFNRLGVDIFKLLIDHIMYLAENDRIQYLIDYIEPNDNAAYTLSGKTAVLFIIKLLLNLTGKQDIKLTNLYYDTVLNPDKTLIISNYAKLWRDGYVEMFFDELMENYPNTLRYCNSSLEFSVLIESVIEWLEYSWTLDTNLESTLCSANIKHLLNRICVKGVYPICTDPNGKTIDQLLAEEGFDYKIGENYDILSSLNELVLLLTGIDLSSYSSLSEVSNGFKNLIDKLTSYNVQTILADTSEASIYCFYNNTGIIGSRFGIANITTNEVWGLERVLFKSKSYANNFSDDCKTISVNNINFVTGTIPELPIKGLGNIYGNKNKYWLSPGFSAEVMPECYIGINQGEYKQDYLKSVEGEISAINRLDNRLGVVGNTDDGTISSAEGYHNPINVVAEDATLPVNPIVPYFDTEGYEEGYYQILSRIPNMSVEVLKDPYVPVDWGLYTQTFLTSVTGEMAAAVELTARINLASADLETAPTYAEGYANLPNVNAQDAVLPDHPVRMYLVNKTPTTGFESVVEYTPSMGVEVVQDPVVGVEKGNYTQTFLSGLTAIIQANEHNAKRTKAAAGDRDKYIEKTATSNPTLEGNATILDNTMLDKTRQQVINIQPTFTIGLNDLGNGLIIEDDDDE